MNTCFIEYLNASQNFQKDFVYFEGATAYEDAVEWEKAHLENFNLDMIK